jgi:regulator of sigma E protease
MEIVNTIFYFLIVIGILVFIHEFGHFIAARSCGMRAEIFAFGMGFRLFGYNKVNGFTFGKLDETLDLGDHTDYRVCAFPIGGFVKVAGMIDESMDKEFIKSEPKPWEYRSKPVWKRIIVITAGVLMNIFLAFLIFYSINFIKGKSLIDTTTIGYVQKNSISQEIGLKAGDKILSINNKEIKYWDDIRNSVFIDNMGESMSIKIFRNRQEISIYIPKEKLNFSGDRDLGISTLSIIPVITDVFKEKPAESAGIQKGDVITYFAGEKIVNTQQLIDLIKENVNIETEIEWSRNGQILKSRIKPLADSTIGIGISSKYEGPIKEINYNFITAIPKAASDLYYYGIEIFFKSIAKIIKGDIPFKKAIGGPIKIAQASAQSAEGGFFTFIGFVALLSMSLAVINILPFPALDGGHFVLLIIEGVFRRPVPFKVQEVLQKIGFAILIAFMLFVLYNDIISLK